MLSKIVLSFVGILWAGMATATPFDGDWELIYSCKGSTGIYAQRCDANGNDFFELFLWSDKNRLCGLHMATSQLGNHVDEDENTDPPSITGIIKNNSAAVSFQSGGGAIGQATIKVLHGKLYWKVIKASDSSWLGPDHAILLRQPESKVYERPSGGCQ